jgi:hypothetical protein
VAWRRHGNKAGAEVTQNLKRSTRFCQCNTGLFGNRQGLGDALTVDMHRQHHTLGIALDAADHLFNFPGRSRH